MKLTVSTVAVKRKWTQARCHLSAAVRRGARFMLGAACALFLVAGWTAAALADPPPDGAAPQGSEDRPSQQQDDQQADIARLIRQLGDERFSLREAATEKLIEIGLPVLGAVEQATESPDREIRYRSERILAIVRQLDFQRRLEAFAANRDSGEDYDLPAWSRYRERMGDDPNARSLFVDMQRAEPDVLRILEESPKAAGHAIEDRCQQLQQAMQLFRQQLSVGNVAALLFVASEAEGQLPQQPAQILYGFCHQPSFRSALDEGSRRDLVRKLLGSYIVRGEDWTAYQGIMLAMQYELKEGLVPAEKMLKVGGNPPHLQQYAILAVAKLGDKSHLPLLEGQLEDNTRLSARRVNDHTFETQVRDVALAALLHVSGQDASEYGFDQLQPNEQLLFNPSTAGFENEEQRAAALAKWKEFRAGAKAPDAADAPEPPGGADAPEVPGEADGADAPDKPESQERPDISDKRNSPEQPDTPK